MRPPACGEPRRTVWTSGRLIPVPPTPPSDPGPLKSAGSGAPPAGEHASLVAPPSVDSRTTSPTTTPTGTSRSNSTRPVPGPGPPSPDRWPVAVRAAIADATFVAAGAAAGAGTASPQLPVAEARRSGRSDRGGAAVGKRTATDSQLPPERVTPLPLKSVEGVAVLGGPARPRPRLVAAF